MAKKKDFITVLMAPHDGELKAISIKNTLQMKQAVVGGLIEVVPMRMTKQEWKAWPEAAKRFGVPHIKTPIFIVNEEGLIKDLPRNHNFPMFCGTVFLMEHRDLD